MVTIENCVRASNDDLFKCIQKFARYSYQSLVDESELVEFVQLCVQKTNLCGYLGRQLNYSINDEIIQKNNSSKGGIS